MAKYIVTYVTEVEAPHEAAAKDFASVVATNNRAHFVANMEVEEVVSDVEETTSTEEE